MVLAFLIKIVHQISVGLLKSLFEHEIFVQFNGRIVERLHVETKTFSKCCLSIWHKKKRFCALVPACIEECRNNNHTNLAEARYSC